MKIDITPSLSIFNTYKNFRYTLSSALFEYFDNSTSSFFENSTSKKDRYIITLVDRRDSENHKLMIIDNANGMNKENFIRAIKIDNKQKMSGRNRFGVGLKVSAIWFSDIWSVETLEIKTKNFRKFTFDLNEVQNSSSSEFEYEEIKKEFIGDEYFLDFNHGTIITLNKPCDIPVNKNSIEPLIKNISSQFSNDIKNEDVKFIIAEIKENKNGSIEFIDQVEKYFGTEGSKHIRQKLLNCTPIKIKDVTWKKVDKVDVVEDINIDIIDPKNSKEMYTITGKVGWIENSGVGKGGFKRLWKNRALESSLWKPEQILGKPNSYIAQRMYGELDFSQFEPSNSKDGFLINSDLNAEIIKVLSEKLTSLKRKINGVSKREAQQKKVQNIKEVKKSFNKVAPSIFENNKELNNKVIISDFDSENSNYGLLEICKVNVKITTKLSDDFNNDDLITPYKCDDENYEYVFLINARHNLITFASQENLDNIIRMIYLICYSEVVSRVKFYVENDFVSLSHIKNLNKKFFEEGNENE